MKKYLFALTALVIMCSCEKNETNDFPLASDFFRAEKMPWKIQTKAGSKLDKADTEWKIGDEVTVFSESGECHNFIVVECDGLSATFDCKDYSFSEGVKYKLFYPSLPDGWLSDGSFVLTYNFVKENSAQKVGDWCCSDWAVPVGDNALSFTLEHMNSLLDLTLTLPADGQLERCYLRALPLDAGEEEVRVVGNNPDYGFCYKDRYIFNGTDFERDPEGGYNKMYEFNLVFDVDKEFTAGEIMESLTPIDSDEYSGLNDLYLILVYTDGKVFSSEVSLPDMTKGNCYPLQISEFQELSEIPFSEINWGSNKDNELLTGEWPAIELSTSELTFDSTGGSLTVEAKNYSVWWIEYINITGTDTNYDADKEDDYPYISKSASADGISVKIGPESNQVTITVDPSSDKHDWKVCMSVGDTGTGIRVMQN